MNKQAGFAAQGVIILSIIVFVVVGGGYFVLSRQLKNEDPNIVASQKDKIFTPTGNPEETVSAVEDQLNTETLAEVDLLSKEDLEAELDPSTISDLEGAIDESNL